MVRGGEINEVSQDASAPVSSGSVSSWAAPPTWRAPASHRVPDVRCLKPYVGAGRLAFPCGQCLPCRLNKRRIWTHRLMLEGMQHADKCFVTLTYETEPEGGSLEPGHVRNWLKRLRLRCVPARLRYFVVGEYGDKTMRPHYHAAIFGLPSCAPERVLIQAGGGRLCQCWTCSVVRETWGFGHVFVGTLEERSAAYISGYVTKKMTSRGDSRLAGRYPEFARMSLKPGIGAGAIPDVASVMMQYQLEKRGDVPVALRHGAKQLPLGRYLRKQLRVQVGLPEKAPVEYLEAMREGLCPVYEATDLVCSAPGMGRFRKALAGQILEDVNRQAGANVAARSLVSKGRTL